MRFETEDLRIKRLNNIVERVATAFFVQNFNLRRAFSLFDRDGDGQISMKEFRQGWLTLGIDLNYEEIDDLMKLVDTDGSGHISYDEFISKMDVHLKSKQAVAGEEAHEVLFHKLKALLDNQDKSLFEYMADFDYDNTGTIMT
jgi:Ca2+-binding EF-hand superfamily protein